MNRASPGRRSLAEALAALAPLPRGGFTWFGEAVPAPPGSRHRLRMRLYLDWYAPGRAVPAATGPRVIPSDGHAAAYLARLRTANAGTSCRSPGWRVVGRTDAGTLVSRGGPAVAVADGAVTASEDDATTVEVVLPPEDPGASPGHYTALGSRGLTPDAARGRIYWNLTPDGAVVAMEAVTRTLADAGIAFAFKVPASPVEDGRADRGVLYVHREDAGRALGLARDLALAHPRILHPEIPTWTLPIAPGIGYADDPPSGESFGLHRCGLVADAVLASWSAGRHSPAAVAAEVERRLAAEGVSLDTPHRAGPADPVLPPRSSRPAPVPAPAGPLEAAAAIGRALCASAVHHGDRCSWLVPRAPAGARPELRPAGPSLGGGTAGIALALAELHALTGDPAARRTALAAMRQALGASGGAADAGGLSDGAAGVTLAAMRVGTALGDDGVAARGAALLGSLGPAATPDMAIGRAGEVVVRLALGIGDPAADDAAEALVAAIDAADPAGGGPNGMAHGPAGAGLALAGLVGRRGSRSMAAAVRRALAHDPAPGLGTWCRGAAGIGLARARAAELLDDPVLHDAARDCMEIVCAALRAPARVDADLGLCHGRLGMADALREASRRVPRPPPSWAATADDVIADAVERHHARGRSWPAGPPAGGPGLLLGQAGLILALVRAADPGVASVLLIAPPAAAAASDRDHRRTARAM